MKTLLFLLIFSCFGALKAQGNLQFNQVINMQFTAANTTPVIVPAGKVWKIENCMLPSTSNTYAQMQYNGVIYNLRQQNTSTQVANFPFWFSGGSSLIFGAGGPVGGLLSIIEFNIVP
jgi:hypothetical protein